MLKIRFTGSVTEVNSIRQYLNMPALRLYPCRDDKSQASVYLDLDSMAVARLLAALR
jgi:hypothetical protein